MAMNDDQTSAGAEAEASLGRKPGSARGTAFKIAALLLPPLCLVAGAACWLHAPNDADTARTPPASTEPEVPPGTQRGLFFGWPKQDFVVVLSGEQHGLVLPCGCSSPQFGGYERLANLIESLKKRGWPVVAYNLGDTPQIHGPANLANIQGKLKYHYAMESLREMGYAATTFGVYEAAQPLTEIIDEYALNNPEPAILATNLVDKAKLFPDDTASRGAKPEWGGSYVGSWNVTNATKNIKVGSLAFIGTHTPAWIDTLVKDGKLPAGIPIPPAVGVRIADMDPKFKFQPANKVIPGDLKAINAAHPDFRVLLYQGPVALAKLLAREYSEFNVILCLDVDEPPQQAVIVDKTFIVSVGHKGKYVGVVGGKATGNPARPFEMRYELVALGPEFATPKGKEAGHPILKLMEQYTKQLHDENYLDKYGKVPHSIQAALKTDPKFAGMKNGYVGSEVCGKCHVNEYKIWSHTDHARAYKTLVDARNPSLRQFDAECIVCHTVGFRNDGGFANAEKTPALKNVGCESCHGPGELHSTPKFKFNKTLHALMNPWKAPLDEGKAAKAKRILKIEGMCRECHDSDNDVHWDFAKWEKKKIVHMKDTPPPEDEK